MTSKISTVLFDLDGTLLDTALDLGGALNALLRAYQRPEIPATIFRNVVSQGAAALIKLGFGIDKTHKDFPVLRMEFLNHYQQNILTHTRLFPGVEKTLDFLENNNFRWGIVTNKPKLYTDLIIEGLNLSQRICCVVSADEVEISKPSPLSILLACERAQCENKNCMYVGDAKNDVVAAHAAGMPATVALYGYIDEHINAREWNAENYIERPEDLIGVLRGF